jgi:hypothetical protein
MPDSKKLVQLKLSLALWERLRAAAQADSRSITNYVAKLIERAIEEGGK